MKVTTPWQSNCRRREGKPQTKNSKITILQVFVTVLFVTWSDEIGLTAYLKALRNDGFKYLVYWNLPVVKAT